MQEIEFTEFFSIPSATAQQRGHGAHGRTWESPGLKEARAAWRALFEKHRPMMPIDTPVEISLSLFYHRKGVKNGIAPRKERPDLDNIVKVVNDALVKSGYIIDDNLVFSFHASKFNQSIQPEYIGFRLRTEIFSEWIDSD